MNIPTELQYTNNHEWIAIEGSVATVGITDFAQSELGEIVFIEVETLGEMVKEEQSFGIIEAVKTVTDLFAPLAGKVVQVNKLLSDNPGLINKDPYGEGWIIKMELSTEINTANLIDFEAYKKITGS